MKIKSTFLRQSRKNQKLAFILILLIVAFCGVKSIYSKSVVTTLKEPENLITIAHKKTFRKLEYGEVIFEHQKHVEGLAKTLKKPQELVCQECHAQDKYGNFIFDFPKNINKNDSQALKNAYHKQCLKCHQKLSIEKKKTGPVILSCRDCHKKEFASLALKHPVVEFDFSLHDKHVTKHDKDCSQCHHVYDIEEKNKDLALVYEKGKEQSCYYCHDLNKKKGPEISKIVKVVKEKDLNIEQACHNLCLNCHLQNKALGKDAGPIICSKCHTGKYKTVDELKDIPRPDRGQSEKAFIKAENAKMKGVAFEHRFHEKNNKTCRICHHETLKACKDCHNLTGKTDGGFVNILTAYHSQRSEFSCQGCHKNLTAKKECSGCHYFIPPIKTEIGSKEICGRCHTDKKEIEKVNPFSISPNQVKKELSIKHIEKEFEPAKMPHFKIIKKLTDLSNKSKLATYFHKNIETLCKGCHHKSKEEVEAKKNNPPLCISCHNVFFEPTVLGKPRIQSAYHTMCIKCHENMGIEKPKKCTDCHERKRGDLNVYN